MIVLGKKRIVLAVVAFTTMLVLCHRWSTLQARLGSHVEASVDEDDKFLWRRIETIHPPKSIRPLPTGSTAWLPRIQASFPRESSKERATRLIRREVIKKAFQRSWSAYKRLAWLRDEVRPVSGQYRDTFGGWGATLVDSLDTLWIMGMKDEFYRAVKAVDEKISFEKAAVDQVNVFETTIRFLGGLLAAYELSGDKRLLRKARDVGDMAYKAFDTPNRMPVTRWDFHKAAEGADQTANSQTLLAELGSMTMEFTRLSLLTKDPKYYDAVQRISELLAASQGTTLLPGMWPIVVDAAGTRFDGGTEFSLGAMADSAYEYLPKMVALLGGQHGTHVYRDMYVASMDAAQRHLFYRPMTPDRADVLFPGTVHATVREGGGIETVRTTSASHLGCFVGGMLALGGRLVQNETHVEMASQMTLGCVWAYAATSTGVMPEVFQMAACPDHSGLGPCDWDDAAWKRGVTEQQTAGGTAAPVFNANDFITSHRLPKGITTITDSRYVLRPEAVESVFVMYRTTGDPAWAERAWAMWQAIEHLTRTDLAYSAARTVHPREGEALRHEDSMESFWLGETLKYFYLVFSEPDELSLDEWVFNTEAHPFKRLG